MFGGGFDPTDMFDFLDTKKKLPGERKPVFPEGVPGVEQGVPQEMVRGNPANQQQQCSRTRRWVSPRAGNRQAATAAGRCRAATAAARAARGACRPVSAQGDRPSGAASPRRRRTKKHSRQSLRRSHSALRPRASRLRRSPRHSRRPRSRRHFRRRCKAGPLAANTDGGCFRARRATARRGCAMQTRESQMPS